MRSDVHLIDKHLYLLLWRHWQSSLQCADLIIAWRQVLIVYLPLFCTIQEISTRLVGDDENLSLCSLCSIELKGYWLTLVCAIPFCVHKGYCLPAKGLGYKWARAWIGSSWHHEELWRSCRFLLQTSTHWTCFEVRSFFLSSTLHKAVVCIISHPPPEDDGHIGATSRHIFLS